MAGGGRGDEPGRDGGRGDAASTVCHGRVLHAAERRDSGRALRAGVLPAMRARRRAPRFTTRTQRRVRGGGDFGG
eukprot:scaffold8397_cov48-Phaeocystis_antarctica.AAC.1